MYKQIYRKCIIVSNYSRKHVLKKNSLLTRNKTILCIRHALPQIAEDSHIRTARLTATLPEKNYHI